MERRWGNIYPSRKVCKLDVEEVPHGEYQIHGDTSRKYLEERGCYFM